MPLPASGAISLADIAAEFGGTTAHSLSEYYAGGAYVPAGTSGTNGAVPSSGAISLWHFYGTQKVVGPAVAMPDVTDYYEAQFGTVSAGINVMSNGGFTTVGGWGEGPHNGDWLTAGASSDVQVYATYSGGAGASWQGTWNTWVTLSSTVSLYMQRATNGSSSGTISLTFRNKNTLAQLDTASVSVSIYRGIPV